jgi:hypothetical protein
MILRNIEPYDPTKSGYKTVDPNAYIERLKRLRAVGAGPARIDRGGARFSGAPFGDIRILLKPR